MFSSSHVVFIAAFTSLSNTLFCSREVCCLNSTTSKDGNGCKGTAFY